MGKVTTLNGGEGEAGPQRLQPHEIDGEANPPNESVGLALRTARLKRAEELSQVSQALRIRKDYLEALETDRPQNLPGRTYAVGFVRAYAIYLGLDAAALVSRYKLATAELGETAPQVGPAPEMDGFRWSAGWSLSALAVAMLLVYGVYALSRSPGPAVPNAGRVPAPVEAHATRLRPVLPHAALDPAAVASKAGAVATASGQVLGMQNQGSRVVLHASALTHVLVDGPGGKVYINRLLHPGDVYRVPNMVGLSLTTPNGGAVSLELDGRDMGAAGKVGRLVEALSLNPAAIVDRKSAGIPGAPDKVTP